MRGELFQLSMGVFAWLGDPPGHGRPNAGAVLDADGITVIDTLISPADAELMRSALEAFDMPIRRVVLTGSHVPWIGGSQALWEAAFYGTEQTSDMADLPPNVDGYRRIYPDQTFDDDLTTRPVTHTVDRAAWLTPAVQVLPLPGAQAQNLVALVLGAGICFAGAVATFGATPLGFEAYPVAWAHSLDQIADLATVIVPGQGPVGGEAEARALAGYLRACHAAEGDVDAIAPGPWDSWANRHFDAVNVERAALLADGEDRIPDAMLRLVGLA